MKYLVLALSKFIKLIILFILYLYFNLNKIGDIGTKYIGLALSKLILLTYLELNI